MKKPYTYTEVMKLLKCSNFMVYNFKEIGLIKSNARGEYDRASVDRLVQARNEGVNRKTAAKILKINQEDVSRLTVFGYIKKHMPEYARSNYTMQSINEVKKHLEKNDFYGRKKK